MFNLIPILGVYSSKFYKLLLTCYHLLQSLYVYLVTKTMIGLHYQRHMIYLMLQWIMVIFILSCTL